MAISVNWATRRITVPKADTTLVDIGPPEIRSLDVDQLRKDLKALEDDEDGIVFPDTHQHNTEETISGETYPRQVEFINGYTIEFPSGYYICTLTDADNNIIDVVVNIENYPVRIEPFNAAAVANASEITDMETDIEATRVQATIAANNTQSV